MLRIYLTYTHGAYRFETIVFVPARYGSGNFDSVDIDSSFPIVLH